MGYSPGEKRGPGKLIDIPGSLPPSSRKVHPDKQEIKQKQQGAPYWTQTYKGGASTNFIVSFQRTYEPEQWDILIAGLFLIILTKLGPLHAFLARLLYQQFLGAALGAKITVFFIKKQNLSFSKTEQNLLISTQTWCWRRYNFRVWSYMLWGQKKPNKTKAQNADPT